MSAEEQTNKAPEAQAWGDPEGKGMLGRLDELDDVFNESKRPEPKAEEKPVEETKKEPEPIKPEETQVKEEAPKVEDETKEEAASEDDDLPTIDSDFFDSEEDDKEKKTDESFDEKEFDSETDKIVKALEEKGHPGDAYKDLRAELKEYKQREKTAVIPEEAQKEVEELKIKAQEAEGLRERLKEATSSSARLQLETSDEYQDSILKPVESILERSGQIADISEVDPQLVQDIIRTQDIKERDQLLRANQDSLGPVGTAEISRLASEFHALRSKRDEMMENAEQRIEEQRTKQIKEESRLLEEHKGNVQSIQKDMWEKNKESIPGLVDENGEPTKQYQELLNKSLSIDFATARAKDQAFAAFAGTVLPHLARETAALKKKLAQYESGDSKARKSSPSPSSSVKQTAVSDSSNKHESFADRFANADIV